MVDASCSDEASPAARGLAVRSWRRSGVGPFAQAGLHQPLSLAVGARGVWARAQVTHAHPTDQAAEAARSVAGAVVGQDALELHAQAPVAAHRPQQRPARAATSISTHYLPVNRSLQILFSRLCTTGTATTQELTPTGAAQLTI